MIKKMIFPVIVSMFFTAAQTAGAVDLAGSGDAGVTGAQVGAPQGAGNYGMQRPTSPSPTYNAPNINGGENWQGRHGAPTMRPGRNQVQSPYQGVQTDGTGTFPGQHSGMRPGAPGMRQPGFYGPQGMRPAMGPRPGHPGMRPGGPGMHQPGFYGPRGMHPAMGPRPIAPGMHQPGFYGPRGMRPGIGPRPVAPGMRQPGFQGPRQGMRQPGFYGPRGMRPVMGPRPVGPGMRQPGFHRPQMRQPRMHAPMRQGHQMRQSMPRMRNNGGGHFSHRRR